MRKARYVRNLALVAILGLCLTAGACGSTSRVASSVPVSTTLAAVANCAATGAAVRPATVSAHPATIRSVAIRGSASAPRVVVVGSNFGSTPAPNPPICPAKTSAAYHFGCDHQLFNSNKPDGFDYGPTTVGLGWGASLSQFSAGEYSPGAYLDCIGVVIDSWSPTRVVFSLGSQYALYTPLKPGAKYVAEVRGSQIGGIVHYPADAPA
jgi:hypothetical protein